MDEIKEIFDKAYDLSDKISKDLKELEELIWKNYQLPIDAKIDFPQGVLRRAENIRICLPFINDGVLKTNLSYHLMLADFYDWFLNRFGISLTGQEMLIKESICLYGNICAAVFKDVVSKNKKVKECIKSLFEQGIINENLKNNLEWLWATRNKEHIEDLEEWEFKKYSLDDYKRASDTWKLLMGSLLSSNPRSKGVTDGQ